MSKIRSVTEKQILYAWKKAIKIDKQPLPSNSPRLIYFLHVLMKIPLDELFYNGSKCACSICVKRHKKGRFE